MLLSAAALQRSAADPSNHPRGILQIGKSTVEVTPPTAATAALMVDIP